MKETSKNISIISQNLEPISDIKAEIGSLKAESKRNNPLLKNINTFEKSPFFEKQILKKWEYLMQEWDIDNNLYIVKNWVLSVEKNISNWKNQQLAIIKTWEFVWEWWFDNSNTPKDVDVIALSKTELLKIDLKEWFKKFIEELPNIWFEILKYIIVETNKRLLEVNRLFTSSSEMEQTINSIKNIDLKTIFWLIDKIKNIIDSDYILYFEKHSILKNILTLRYDSRTPNKMLDIIFERAWYFLDLDELYEKANIWKNDQIIISKISIWDEVYWFLILWREKRIFSWWDKRIISWISNSLAWIVKKFLQDKEDKNKIYITEMKKI